MNKFTTTVEPFTYEEGTSVLLVQVHHVYSRGKEVYKSLKIEFEMDETAGQQAEIKRQELERILSDTSPFIPR